MIIPDGVIEISIPALPYSDTVSGFQIRGCFSRVPTFLDSIGFSLIVYLGNDVSPARFNDGFGISTAMLPCPGFQPFWFWSEGTQPNNTEPNN